MIEEKIDKETIEAIKKIYYKIFRNRDPYGEPFREEFECVIALYLYDSNKNEMYLGLTSPQYNALINTIKDNGEDGFYISGIESNQEAYEAFDEKGNLLPGFPPDIGYTVNRYYKILLPEEWENYLCTIPILDRALYSFKGSWGCSISSQDPFALLGGTRDFIKTFKKYYPGWEKDFQEFKRWYDDYLVTGYYMHKITKYFIPYVIRKSCE